MPIIIKNGLRFFDKPSGIIIEPNKIKQCVNYINNNDIKDVVISSFFGYKLDNITFLEECPEIESLNIDSPFIKNISPISKLRHLNKLVLISPFIGDYSPIVRLKSIRSLFIDRSPILALGKSSDAKLDLAMIPFLESLSIQNSKNVLNINQCKSLKRLWLGVYNPISKDLEELAGLENLQTLKIVKSTITSFQGLKSMCQLKKLGLTYLSDLYRLDDLDGAENSLKILRFENCKNIQNHRYVAKLKELRILDFDKCGNIASIEFIKQMHHLKAFIFLDSNVVNGDISPCLGLEYVVFSNKKHYSHNMKNFPNNNLSPELKELFKWEKSN
jgi:protein phosphatase 1 regulatory subunit 7